MKIEIGGGLRLEQHKDVLSFTVNESLHLESGQGIEEMLGISLEPDIAIETYHDYVQIRGIIILQGECKKTTENIEEVESIDHSITNYIEKIIDTEPGQAMFSHRFPVEVSVPKNRIRDTSNVKVEVVSFDYELPSTHRLNINATLHIHGIVADEIVSAPLETSETTETPEKTSKTSKEDEKTATFDVMPETSALDKDMHEEKESTEKVTHTEELETGNQAEEEVTIIDAEQTPSEDSTTSEAMSVKDDKLHHDEKDEIDIQLSEMEEKEEEQVNDVLFLTDLFGGIAEESSTTLRIHIIQEEDTIESVAKRYDVSALQLMKDNQLSADEMIPGNLIHIENKNK